MYRSSFSKMVHLQFSKTYFFEVFTLLLSILIIIFVYPLLILFYLPCWTYRCFVELVVKKNPKFGNILKGIDARSAGQAPYSNPDCILLTNCYLSDQLDVPKVVKVLKNKIIWPGLFPELRQKIVAKYGYHFWCTTDNFKIEDHVRNLNSECPNIPVTRSQLRQVTNSKLIRLPFNPERSPWELIVVANYIDERCPELKSVLMFRFNHCVMDGYSLYTFLMKTAEKPWKWILAPKTDKKYIGTSLIDVCNFVKLLVLGPYYFLKMFVFCNDNHEFVENIFKPDYKDVWNTQCTSAVSKNRLKSVQDSYKVSFSALITAILGQAIHKTMKCAQVNKLTKTLHCFFSYPMPGRINKLTNHWTIVKIPIQVNEDDPVKTLEFVEKQFKSLRNSVEPLVFFYVSKMIALAPLWLRYSQTKLPPTTFVLTNFPGPCGSDIFGCQWTQANLTGRGTGGTAFMTSSLSVNDDFLFEVQSPVCNIPNQDDVDMLSDNVLETLADLESRR